MTLSSEELRHRLDGIRNLPTLPAIYQKVQAVMRDADSSARDVGAVVAEDPALTARLLKMVNSAFYGLSREISTIDQGVVILGLRELEHVILATTVLKVFPGKGAKTLFDLTEFWKHALGTAIAAREISRRTSIGRPDELFTMGLLHDIGKLVLDLFFYDDYVTVLNQVSTRTDPIRVIEQETLGFDHADVGAILAAKWELPMHLVDVIQYHHAPKKSAACQEEAAVVNFADVLCRAKNWGFPGDPHVPALAEGTIDLLHLEPSHIEPMMHIIEGHYQDGLALLELS